VTDIYDVISGVDKDLELDPELRLRLRGAIERLAYFTQRRITSGERDDENILNCLAQIEAIAGQHAMALKDKLNERIRAFIAFGFDILLSKL
jgi:hypothetical protein